MTLKTSKNETITIGEDNIILYTRRVNSVPYTIKVPIQEDELMESCLQKIRNLQGLDDSMVKEFHRIGRD